MRRLFTTLLILTLAILVWVWFPSGADAPDVLSGAGPAPTDEPDPGPGSATEESIQGSRERGVRHEASSAPEPAGSELAESPTPALLTFRCVTKETGAPIQGIGFTLDVDGRALISYSEAQAHLTDAAGERTFEVPAGVRVEIQAWGETTPAGLVLAEVGPYAAGEEAVETLEHPTAIDLVFHGRVVDQQTGAPLSNMTIEPMFDSDLEVLNRTVRSDANGVFRLELPSWMMNWRWVTGDGYGRIAFQPVTGHESSLDALELRLPRAATLRGTVTRSDGSPAAGVTVVASTTSRRLVRPRGAQDNTHLMVEPRSVTDASGHYELAGLTAGSTYDLRIEDSDRILMEAPPIRLEPGEERELSWSLPATATIVGEVLDGNDRPVPHLSLWLVPAESTEPMRLQPWHGPQARIVTADATGAFRIEDVPVGSWHLGPAHVEDPAAVLAAPISTVVEIGEDDLQVQVLVRAWTDLAVEGQVLNEEGQPVPEVSVGVWTASHGSMRVLTDDEGRFLAAGLTPEVHEFGVGGWGEAWAESEPVLVDPREQDTVTITALRGGRIRGRVLTSEGEPASGRVHIAGRRMDGAIPSWTRVGIRIEGTYELSGLEPGSYDLVARTEDGLVGSAFDVRLDGGVETKVVDLQVEQAGVLVLVPGDDGPEWSNATMYLDGAFVGHGGTLGADPSEIPLPAGLLDLRLKDSSGRETQRALEIRAGERTEVDLGPR